VISRTCALARYLERRIAETPELELLAPVELNVVCFRYRAEDAQRINPRIVIELQESGVVAPSTTIIDGRLAIRAAIVNHRTGRKRSTCWWKRPWPWDAPWKPALLAATRRGNRVRRLAAATRAGIRPARSRRPHRVRSRRGESAI
jgi:glutamate/tyrosine decarboxylase-like PLP-dependent enzyme